MSGVLDGEERARRGRLAQRIRVVGRMHRAPVALYRDDIGLEGPVAVGVVQAIETDGVRIAGSFVPWSGMHRAERWEGPDWMVGGRRRLDDDGRPISEPTTCGTCGRTWDDALITSRTPVPSGRCPFEAEHEPAVTLPTRVYRVAIVTADGPEQPRLTAGDVTDAIAEEFACQGVELVGVHVQELSDS